MEPAQKKEPLVIRGSWYRDGSDYVVVLTGMPEHAVQIGVGSTVEEAWEHLQTTALQSVGRDSGESAALSWAHGQGWCSDPAELEPADEEAANDVIESVGDVDWSAKVEAYVSCVYGRDGDQPGDCYVRIGEDELGLWWLDDGDDAVRMGRQGPFNREREAREAAKALAAEQHEGQDGEDAADMRDRVLHERAGQPDPDGEWCVYWDTALDDSHVVDRYKTRDAASAAAEIAQAGLEASHPGAHLLCRYGVRHLVEGKWVKLEDDC